MKILRILQCKLYGSWALRATGLRGNPGPVKSGQHFVFVPDVFCMYRLATLTASKHSVWHLCTTSHTGPPLAGVQPIWLRVCLLSACYCPDVSTHDFTSSTKAAAAVHGAPGPQDKVIYHHQHDHALLIHQPSSTNPHPPTPTHHPPPTIPPPHTRGE